VAGSGAPSLAARLEVVGAAAAVPGGGLRYAVVNTGEVPILLGTAYGLERLGEAGWKEVALPYWFPACGLRLELRSRLELTARIPDDAQPGRHRLRKPLQADRDPHPGYEWVATSAIRPIELTLEFDVGSA
jgi:hypothetical protein